MGGSVRGRAGSVALALALVALLILNVSYHVIDVRHAKNHALENEIFVKWNSFSRIGVVQPPDGGMKSIVIDADAATGIPNFDFNHLTADDRRDLMEQGFALPYAIRPGAKTLIIGPGGGWDVARALCSGSTDITAVEINPIIASTIMREQYPQLSHRLYLRPEVHVFVEDGRSFVRRSSVARFWTRSTSVTVMRAGSVLRRSYAMRSPAICSSAASSGRTVTTRSVATCGGC